MYAKKVEKRANVKKNHVNYSNFYLKNNKNIEWQIKTLTFSAIFVKLK